MHQLNQCERRATLRQRFPFFFIGCHRVSIFIILAFIFLCYFKIKLYSYCAKSKMFVVMVAIHILDGCFPFIIVFFWRGWMTQHIIFNVLWIFHCFWFALCLAISVSSSYNSSIAFGKRTTVADFISFSGTCGFIIFPWFYVCAWQTYTFHSFALTPLLVSHNFDLFMQYCIPLIFIVFSFHSAFFWSDLYFPYML